MQKWDDIEKQFDKSARLGNPTRQDESTDRKGKPRAAGRCAGFSEEERRLGFFFDEGFAVSGLVGGDDFFG